MLNNQEFFDELAHEYDSMIAFEKAVEVKKKSFKNIFKNKNLTIADIGCGTGSDSIALAEFGCKVVSFDPSAEMLKKAKLNAKNRGLDFDSYQFGATQIPGSFNGKFNVVLSIGNTFANIGRNHFHPSIKKCYDLLKENGNLLIQILNYKLILKEKKRIVNITESDNNFFIRFYDFEEDEIKFNIFKFSKSKPYINKLITTSISPYTAEDFNSTVLKAGFKSVKNYSDFKRNNFKENTSKNLFIEAVK